MAGAIIGHDSTIEPFCHINAGSVIKAGIIIPGKTKVDDDKVRK